MATAPAFVMRSFFVCLFAVSSVFATEVSSAPWRDAPFSADARDLLIAASAVEFPGNPEIAVLYKERTVSFDDEGLATRRFYLVYRILDPAGVRTWAEVSSDWSPWYEERPELRARVITRDGKEHWLDQSTISDSPAREISPTIYSDRRTIRAPLPALATGAVVEEEVIVREKKSFFEGGTVQTASLDSSFPTQRGRFEIEYPSSLPVRFGTRGFELQPERSESGGRVRVSFEGGPYERLDIREAYLPDDVARWRLIVVSSAESWERVAGSYSEIVDERIRDADVSELVEGLDHLDSRAQIELLVNRLHEKVRYTGLEFGEASIVPATPAEVLKRHYGDCKDKAALLTAALRSLGHQASLALLLTGPGLDVDSRHPGLGQFDHAIVYVAAEEPLWIDATAELHRVGVVPSGVEGRLALIAAPSSRELVRIPASTSADNLAVETREITLAEYGRGNLTETTLSSGAIEADYRAAFSGSDESNLRKLLKSYVESAYGAKDLGAVSRGDTRNLLEPFVLSLEATEVQRAFTDLEQAVVAIPAGSLLTRLPAELLESGDTSRARAHDFVIPLPYREEWRYVVAPPDGYVSSPLPDDESLSLGTARYESRFRALDGGRVEAVFTFDSGKRRISPDELTELRKHLVEFQKRPVTVLGFEEIGQAHLARGEMKEAIAHFQDLVEMHPDRGLWRARLATAYLSAGLGQAARDEIDRAIALDPDRAILHRQRGFILQHDLLGRQFRQGFDVEGAAASWRRAFELEPDDASHAINRAIVLEHDQRGRRYRSGARLDEAIAQYEEIGTEIEQFPDFRTNQPAALVYAKRFDDLQTFVADNSALPLRSTFRLIAEVGLSGPDATTTAAARIFDRTERAGALQNAANTFSELRMYPEAASLMSEAAKGSANAAELTAQADLLRRITPHDAQRWPVDDPATVVRRLVVNTLRADDPLGSESELMDPLVLDSMSDDEREARRAMLQSIRAGGESMDPEVLADITLALTSFAVEGDDTQGHRVRAYGSLGGEGATESFIVVRRKDGYRILGSNLDFSGVGIEVLDRIDAGRPAEAKVLLDWAREDRSGGVTDKDDPLAGAPLAKLWRRGDEPDAMRMRVAAASLLVERKSTASRAIPHLLAARETDLSDAERLAVDLVLTFAWTTLEEHEKAAEEAEALLSRHPESDTALVLFARALTRLERFDTLDALLRDRLERRPRDPMALRLTIDVLAEREDLEEAINVFERFAATGTATALDYNNAAWYALGLPEHLDRGVELAQHANRMTDSSHYAILNTLAALYAAAGKTEEAKLLVWRGLDVVGRDEPRDPDWYVLGRIAEHYGVPEVAREAYQRVSPPRVLTESRSTSVWMLAQKRLQDLD